MIGDFHIEVPEPRPSSAQRKLARAGVLIGQLVSEVETFEQSDAFVLRFAVDVCDSTALLDCFIVQKADPAVTWGLLASEALHNLRTSLDHAVWARTAEWSTRSHLARFPICDSAADFDAHREDLVGVDAHARTIIERVQPFNAPGGPLAHDLSILRNLTDWDAHQLFDVDVESRHEALLDFDSDAVQLLTALPSWENASGETYRFLDRHIINDSDAEPTVIDHPTPYAICILGVPIVGAFESIWWRAGDIVREIENG